MLDAMSWWLMEDLCASCPELSDGMQAATEAPRFIFNPRHDEDLREPLVRRQGQGQGSLVDCCLWGHTESDTTEAT